MRKVTESTFVDVCALSFGHEKTSYATAEDPDSERAKNQIRIRSRGAPAERARSAYDGCITFVRPDFGHEKTSYAPVIARIPLLPSGPGGVFQDNAT